MQIRRGFLLTSHWTDSSSALTISFYGTDGVRPFKLVFTNQKIVFFIQRSAQFNPSHIDFERVSGGLKNFAHLDVDTIYLKRYRDVSLVKEYCENNAILTYELDIRPPERFLMERFINGELEFIGAFHEQQGVDIYLNPEVRSAAGKTPLKTLSFDIETGINNELYSIGMHQEHQEDGHAESQKQIVLMLNDKTRIHNDKLHFFSSEKTILLQFIKLIQEWDPDIIIGWHVIGFDLKFLEKKCHQYNLDFKLGRLGEEIRINEKKGAGFFADIPGRVVLDGPPTLRAAFYQFKNFKLETVATEILGVGKDIASDSGKVSEIERRFKEDKLALAKYNLLDCTLVIDIFNKLNIINQMIKRCHISGLLLDRLNVSTAAFDHLYLPRLHRNGFIAPNRIDIVRDEAATGGLVIEPKAGLHQNVSIFDFKSLYPSIIMTFKIDPYSRIQNEIDPIKTPEGFRFSKTKHILPNIIESLMEQRQIAKDQNDPSLSQAVKILMNSFYGVMGSSRCRFYHADLPTAITTTGHWILNSAMDFFRNRGFEIIYGDTDSIFIKNPNGEVLDAEENNLLAKDLDAFLNKILRDQFNVESKLICEFEKTFDQLFFSRARGGEGTAKKRYTGIRNGQLEFKGMEFIRSDWTDLAKGFQKELYQMFFLGENLNQYIKKYIQDLKDKKYDDQLIYTKRLSKAPHEYTKNIPIHVRAALKIKHDGPYRLKEVSYIINKNGPEPVNSGIIDYDYEHYIEKQLKPIANDILHSLGEDFDSFINGDQLSLF